MNLSQELNFLKASIGGIGESPNGSLSFGDTGNLLILPFNVSSPSINAKGNTFFHLYQVFIFFSIALPWMTSAFTFKSQNIVFKELYSLSSLLFAHTCGIIWSLVPLIQTEVLLWMIAIFIILALRILATIYQNKPIVFDREIEEVYTKLFKPLHLTTKQFQAILQCMRGIVNLSSGEELVSEKVSRVDSLSLVLSGRLLVTQCGKPLHFVPPHQFIDSPEWFGVTTDEYFQISATALEESRVLIWHRDRLKLTLMKEQFLQTILEHIIGRDVVKKLTQTQQDEDVPSVKFAIESEELETEKAWMASHSEEISLTNGGNRCGNGTLINGISTKSFHIHPLEVESSTWSLGRISEHDDETPV